MTCPYLARGKASGQQLVLHLSRRWWPGNGSLVTAGRGDLAGVAGKVWPARMAGRKARYARYGMAGLAGKAGQTLQVDWLGMAVKVGLCVRRSRLASVHRLLLSRDVWPQVTGGQDVVVRYRP